MRKRMCGRKLGRDASHKYAMLRNMVTSLIKHERIVTTVPKAKELKYLAERVITLGKNYNKSNDDGKLSAIRHAASIIREPYMVTKLFNILGPRYNDRSGGYTRILKLSKRRKGDNAPMAVIEYVDRPGEIRVAKPPPSRYSDVLKEIGIEPINGPIITASSNNKQSTIADIFDSRQTKQQFGNIDATTTVTTKNVVNADDDVEEEIIIDGNDNVKDNDEEEAMDIDESISDSGDDKTKN